MRGTERLALPVPCPVPTVRETLGAFVRALREGTSFPISVEDGLRAVAIVDAAYRSAERGGEGAAVGGFSGGPDSLIHCQHSVNSGARGMRFTEPGHALLPLKRRFPDEASARSAEQLLDVVADDEGFVAPRLPPRLEMLLI